MRTFRTLAAAALLAALATITATGTASAAPTDGSQQTVMVSKGSWSW
ncbi:hypothetical protein [Arthrobacter sp. NEB 688]|nr:hypothetical protein [Arthrobacter sp. NEB 688]QKE84055.1 hypothetical protein HL663_08970 [Arthrobacter sp. NEB 688]